MHTLALFVAELQHVVVLEVEDVQVVVELCLVHIIVAVPLFELLDTALIHGSTVGQHGAQHIMLGELIVLRHLDTAQDVRDARDAQQAELFGELALHTDGYQVIDTLRCVEQSEQSLAVLVVDVNDHVGVLDVVDPRDMLVTDALDAVTAEAVV